MNEVMHKAIQERAYFLWLEAGCPEGQHLLHWLQAEAEAELGLNPKVDAPELAATQDEGSERPPAGEPYG